MYVSHSDVFIFFAVVYHCRVKGDEEKELCRILYPKQFSVKTSYHETGKMV